LPAWSQDSATPSPTAAAPSFDLSSESIRQIVRATAATQFALVQVPEEKVVESDPSLTIEYVPTVRKEEPPAKVAAAPWARTAVLDGILSWLVETLIDEALGIEEDIPDPWVYCPWPVDLMSANHYEACRRPAR
jgi:hypothetical protein